jgi:hypothetical protein
MLVVRGWANAAGNMFDGSALDRSAAVSMANNAIVPNLPTIEVMPGFVPHSDRKGKIGY